MNTEGLAARLQALADERHMRAFNAQSRTRDEYGEDGLVSPAHTFQSLKIVIIRSFDLGREW